MTLEPTPPLARTPPGRSLAAFPPAARRRLSAAAAFLALGGPATASPFSVEDYVRAAVAASPEVRQAREGFEASRAQYVSQLAAAALPSLSFTGTAFPYGHNPADSYRFTTWRLNRDDMSFTTKLDWNLFNSFQDVQKVRSASLAKDAAAHALDASRQARALEAARAFYDLSLKGRLVEVNSEHMEAQREQHRLTLDLYKNGIKSLTDLLKSEKDWRTAELRLTSARADQKESLMRFNILIDRDPSEPAELKADLENATTALPDLRADTERALDLRPEARRSRSEIDKAGVSLQQSVQGSLPALALSLATNSQDPAAFGLPASTLGVRNPHHYLGLTLSLPVGFNAVSQSANVLAARADRRRAAASLAESLRQVRSQVFAAYVALEKAAATLDLAALQEEIARRNLDVVEEQYRQGSAGIILMAQARLDHLFARVERLQALHGLHVARQEYRHAVGEPIWK